MNNFVYRITLPLPPSQNEAHTLARGRIILSKVARDWREKAHRILVTQRKTMLVGPVELYAHFHVPTLSSDCNNRLKQLEDALTGYAYEDDRQIAETHTKKIIAEGEPKVELLVRSASPVEHRVLYERLARAEKHSKQRELKMAKPWGGR